MARNAGKDKEKEALQKEGRPSGTRRARPTAVRRKAAIKNFYEAALTEAEQMLLPEAREMEGLDEEIALLRVKLQKAVEEHPENFTLFWRGIELLVKAVAAQYRLSKKAEDDLYENILGVLRGIGGALYPEGFSEV